MDGAGGVGYETAVVDAPNLQPPPVPPWFVARPRLVALLQEALRHRLTAVVAGPGYGKSTIVAAWARPWAARGTPGPGDASVSALGRGLVQRGSSGAARHLHEG